MKCKMLSLKKMVNLACKPLYYVFIINAKVDPRIYIANIKSIIPLPDPNAAFSSYLDFPAGSTVMALYPDTSCFYRAEVIATPKELQPSGRVRKLFQFLKISQKLTIADHAFFEIYAELQTEV